MSQQLQVGGIDVFVDGNAADTIVMIHGWPDTYRLWDGQVAALSKDFRCARFTLPGFDSSKPRRAWSLDQTIALFADIVQQVSPGKPVILMLHDWGCMFGYQFYMRHPQLVSKIVGVDIGDAGTKAHAKSLPLKAKLMVLAYQLWLAAAWKIGPALGDGMTRKMALALKNKSDPRYINSGMNYPYYITWTGTYGSYKNTQLFLPACPMLFFYGTRKPFMFHSERWLDKLRQNPQNQVLAMDAGHWVMRDRPDGFNNAVREWLATTSQTAAA